MRSWRTTGANNYWYVRENDPEGTGSIGEPIVLSQGNKKAAFLIAALLNSAYQSGRDDRAAEQLADTINATREKMDMVARTHALPPLDVRDRYPQVGEDLRDLPPGEHLVRVDDDNVMHLVRPHDAVLPVGTKVTVSPLRYDGPPWHGSISANRSVKVNKTRQLLGWYLVTADNGDQEWEVIPDRLNPTETP